MVVGVASAKFDLYVVCIYVQYTDILFKYKEPKANTHVPHKRPPASTSHRFGALAALAPTTVPMGEAFCAAPIGSVVLPFVCVVRILALLCVRLPSSVNVRVLS